MIKIDAAAKIGVALVSILLVSGTAAFADGWAESFATVDANGDGTISRIEWDQNGSKVKFEAGQEFAPTFKAMDSNESNSISKAEWGDAAKTAESYAAWCQSSTESWCKK